MGYLHIDNLYKNQEILMFKECYALEKIHGTSAHIRYSDKGLGFFSGGEKYENFVRLFDQNHLCAELCKIGNAVFYGEAYGGKCQGMSKTYGTELKFVVFDVKIGDNWLSVPQAADLTQEIGLEFVDYVQITTDIGAINAERDKDSVQSIRNGMGEGHLREGVVLRPLIELTKNNGNRIITKHKRDEFRETKTPRIVDDPAKLQVLADAQKVAEEWVTPMRVSHILGKMENPSMTDMRDIMSRMFEDIKREGENEVEWSKSVEKAVGKHTALEVKKYFQNQLEN